MMKMSQRKTITRKKRSDKKRKTVAELEGRASEALQHKIWKSGEQ